MVIDPFAELGSYVFVTWMVITEWILEFFGLIPREEGFLYNLILLSLFALTLLIWHFWVKAMIHIGEEIYFYFRTRPVKKHL
ncbi:hypothetical protein HY604_04365 [Candidatus Peregrinibacteria bacterium]|nr:hypothetical protein [Candidatus Peregrinibacteria bacterium]